MRLPTSNKLLLAGLFTGLAAASIALAAIGLAGVSWALRAARDTLRIPTPAAV